MSAVLAVLAVVCAAIAACALARMQAQGARIARATHEVRGGLCVARLALAASQPALEAAEIQLDRATRALEDLERAARPLEPLEPLDLGALARLAAAGWERVAVDVPALPVRGDRALLTQATTNLIANAVEHGRPPVHVRGRLTGGVARLEVSDAGRGLPASVDALTAAARGSRGRRGHGLSIAAAAARRHGGRLATSPSSAGARLVLELPADRSAVRERDAGASRPGQAPRAADPTGSRPEPSASRARKQASLSRPRAEPS